MDWSTIVVVWIICGIVGAIIGPSRGYAPAVGFGIGLVAGVFGLAFIVLVPGGNETPEEARARQDHERWLEEQSWQQQQQGRQQQNAVHPFNGPPPPDIKR